MLTDLLTRASAGGWDRTTRAGMGEMVKLLLKHTTVDLRLVYAARKA
jgi:hypothetical protein